MSKINEILGKRTPLRKNGEKPDFKKQEGNYKDASGNAVDLYKAQLEGQGSYNTESISEAKSGGTLETDQNKYFKGLYDRFGDNVTTQELIDKKFISKSAGDAYTTFTGGKNKGVLTPGESEDVFMTKPITQTNQESKTTDIPMETNYNMGYNSTVNANWAEGAQRRGTRRSERRAQKDLDIYSGEKRSGFLGLGGKKNKGKLSANVLAAAEKTGLNAEKLKEMGLNVDDKGSITGDADQNVTDQMRARAKSLSQNKYNQGINTEKITQLPSSKTELGESVTSNVKGSEDAIDVSGYNMYKDPTTGSNDPEVNKKAIDDLNKVLSNIAPLLTKSKGKTKNASPYKMPGFGKRS